MADVVVLTILLHDRPIGTLTHMPGDRTLFAFNQDYIDDPNRPTLSLSFKDIYGQLITDVKPTQTRLPPFFSNLLPESPVRDYLAARAGVNPQREFFLLWALGADLPGGMKVRHDQGQPWPDAKDRKTRSADRSAAPLRFSLAGVQLKFSAVKKKRGGLTIPADGVGGSWIVKLPDSKFNGVPENEFAMMELARRIGIDVPETQLLPIRDIAGLPDDIEQYGPNAFAIRRFDRSDGGDAVHMEDFAQVFGIYPERKYEAASYRNIAEVIWIETGETGVREFIRRFVFNALIGNGDMHVKNWSLIYPDGRAPALAPAYDFVATVPYLGNEKLALTFVDSKDFSSLTQEQFRRFAGKAKLPGKLVLYAVEETVQAFAEVWRDVGELGLANDVRQAIEGHLKTLPLWKAR